MAMEKYALETCVLVAALMLLLLVDAVLGLQSTGVVTKLKMKLRRTAAKDCFAYLGDEPSQC